jgi:O-antigen/teichoic acid export membrane protein
MSRTRAIAFDTIAIFTGKAAGLVLGIKRLQYITIYLGLASFGVLNFAAYLLALFTVLADLGLPSLLTRDISRSPSDTRRLMGAGLAFKMVTLLAVTACIVCLLLFSRFDATTTHTVVLTLVAFLFTSSGTVFLSALQAHQKMKLVSVAVLLNDVLNSVGVVVLIGYFPSMTTVLVIGIGVAIVNFAVLAFLCRHFFGNYWPTFDRTTLIYLFQQGYPLALSALGITLYLYIGTTVLKYTRGDADTGIYTAAHRLFSILTLLPSSLMQVIYPILSGLYVSEPGRLPKAFRDALRVMALISIPLAAGTVVLAPGIIPIIYPGTNNEPTAFGPSVPVLAVLVGGVALGYLNWVITSLLLAVNRQKVTMVSTLVVAVFAVAANVLLVPTYGPMAVAWIVAGTDAVLFAAYFLYLARTEYAIQPVALFLKPLVAALCMAGVLLILPRIHVLLAIPLGMVVYAVVMFVLKGFGQQEREMMQGLLRRL